MKNKILIIIIALLVLISIYSVSNYNKSKTSTDNTTNSTTSVNKSSTTSNPQGQTTPSSPFNNEVVSTPAIDFKLKDLDGKEVSLSDLKGKKVFLNFWATWCPPCRAEMPEIEKIYEETKDSDLVILAVDIGEDKDTVKSFIDENNYKFMVLLDSDNEVAAKYQISSIPTSYFIDKNGKIVNKKIGALTYDEMKSNIKALENN